MLDNYPIYEELVRIREVLALKAILVEYTEDKTPTGYQMIIDKLEAYAFPEELAKRISNDL